MLVCSSSLSLRMYAEAGAQMSSQAPPTAPDHGKLGNKGKRTGTPPTKSLFVDFCPPPLLFGIAAFTSTLRPSIWCGSCCTDKDWV